MKKTYLHLWGFLFLTFLSFSYADLTKQINDILNSLESASEAQFWKQVHNLELLGDDAIDVVLDQLDSLGPKARLGCAKFLCSVGELDEGYDLLFQLIRAKGKKASRDVKIQAAEMLVVEGDPGDSTMESEIEEILDHTFDPFVKIPLAKALQMTCGNSRGRKELAALLQSDNALVKLEAALALGEVGNMVQSQLILGNFQREPTMKGQISRALLKKDKMFKRYEQLLFQYRKIPTIQTTDFADKVLDEIFQKIKLHHIYGDRYQKQDLSTAAIDGILNHFDLESFHSEVLRSYDLDSTALNLGLILGYKGNTLILISVPIGSPAYQAGLQSGDIITEINGWPTYRKSREKIAKKLLYSAWETVKKTGLGGGISKSGPRPVNLKVFRTGWKDIKKFTLTLEYKFDFRFHEQLYSELLPAGIAYFASQNISDRVVSKMINQLAAWKKDSSCKAILLDLRGCSSGMLFAVNELLDCFLPKEAVFYREKGKNEELVPEKETKGKKDPIFPTLPLIVLIDGGTAFTGEIIAGALKHHQRAKIVGKRSLGHGFIQKTIPLKSLEGHILKLTAGYYEFPNGTKIHRAYSRSVDGVLNKTGGLLPNEFVRTLPKEKNWYHEEWQIIQNIEPFKAFISKVKTTEIPRILKAESLSKTLVDFDKIYKESMTRMPKKDFEIFVRQKLKIEFMNESLKPVLDLHKDEYLRLGLKYCLEKLGQKPEESAFRHLNLEKE